MSGLAFICLASFLLCSFSAKLRAESKDSLDTIEYNYETCESLEWLDDAHCNLTYGVDVFANGLNDLFKHDEYNLNAKAKTRGRLRFGIEPRTGEFSELDFRFRIRIKLPALENRVELFFSDEEDDLNGQAVKAARSQELGNRDQAVLALQFKKDDDDRMSYRVGFGRGSQVYTRARYSDKIEYSKQSSINYFVEANYYSSDQLGFELNAEYGYIFDASSVFEINNSFRFRDRTNDWIWRHEFQYFYLGKNETSYLFTALIDGLSQPSYRREQMLISMRFKRKVLRDWLFVEVEPFILWLRSEDFRASPGLALRAEVHFSS